jgi:hypothetical protein
MSKDELSIKEIYRKYRGMWVAVIVTKRDANGQPLYGNVVASDVDRYRLRQQTISYREICIFFAGEPDYPLLV